ncbi:hypothetical protein [Rosistilla oblonga]|uniref:hypothetical protein n=1 Tax=Rosistilla oblonga TaxID=2527990 RepID=UPI003A985418
MTKYFALLALLLASNSASAAAVFPKIIDAGPYDGVQNDLGFSVSGFMSDVGGDGAISAGDSFMLAFQLTSNGGNPLVDGNGNGLGIILGVKTSGAGILSSSNLIDNIFGPGQLAGFAGPVANSASAALISGDFNSVGTLENQSDFSDEFAGFQVEALFNLPTSGAGVARRAVMPTLGTNVGSILLTAGLIFSSANSTLPGMVGTSFLPVSVSGGAFNDFALRSVFKVDSAANATTRLVNLPATATGAVNPVPEPASMLTLLGCVGGACAMGRRRRKTSAAA